MPHQSFGSGMSWPTGLSRMPSSLSRYLIAVLSRHRQSPHNLAVVTRIVSCVDIIPASVMADVVACN